MKIGLISFHSFLKPGGVKNHILGLYKEFKKRKIQTKIIVPRREESEKYGRDIILLGSSFPVAFGGSQSDFCINFNQPAVQETLKKEKFDILHFHNFGFPSAFQILAESKALNILTFHSNIEGSNFFKNFPTLLYSFKKIINWKIDGIIGVAPLILNFFKDFDGPKIVIANGIDINEFNPKVKKLKKFPKTDGKIINILFVGRIEKRKGLIYLLKAYEILTKKFSNLRLIIVGEGDLKKDCQKFVSEQNLKEVYFEGEKSGKKLPPYYTTSDIFVSPAIFGESFGIVLLEAMASGVPIVAFANKGYKQFLKGKKGEKFLVRPKNYKALAEKIEILIRNKNLRKEMAKWGIKEAKKYSWSNIANQILDFYQFCLKNKKREDKKISFEKIGKNIDKILNKLLLPFLYP